jgi:hypothetical protein
MLPMILLGVQNCNNQDSESSLQSKRAEPLNAQACTFFPQAFQNALRVSGSSVSALRWIYDTVLPSYKLPVPQLLVQRPCQNATIRHRMARLTSITNAHLVHYRTSGVNSACVPEEHRSSKNTGPRAARTTDFTRFQKCACMTHASCARCPPGVVTYNRV